MIGFLIQLRSKRRPLVVQVRSRSMKRENPALRCPPPFCDGCMAGSKISKERKQILSMYLTLFECYLERWREKERDTTYMYSDKTYCETRFTVTCNTTSLDEFPRGMSWSEACVVERWCKRPPHARIISTSFVFIVLSKLYREFDEEPTWTRRMRSRPLLYLCSSVCVCLCEWVGGSRKHDVRKQRRLENTKRNLLFFIQCRDT